MKNVAVVVPIYQKALSSTEKISLECLKEKLDGEYDIFISTHKELKETIKKNTLLKDYPLIFFPKKFFTYQGYNTLLKSPLFYSNFTNYRYILIYQPDCLVFKKSLNYWANKKIDYVGAPWFIKKKNKPKLIGVGNGGLSLRKVSSFLRVSKLYSKRRIKLKIFIKNLLPSIFVLFHKLFISRNYPKYHVGCRNEDIFWSYAAKQISPDFTVADQDDALKFAFEKYPRLCFEKNGRQLPFGCHAFQKYDFKFWKNFI